MLHLFICCKCCASLQWKRSTLLYTQTGNAQLLKDSKAFKLSQSDCLQVTDRLQWQMPFQIIHINKKHCLVFWHWKQTSTAHTPKRSCALFKSTQQTEGIFLQRPSSVPDNVQERLFVTIQGKSCSILLHPRVISPSRVPLVLFTSVECWSLHQSLSTLQSLLSFYTRLNPIHMF